MKEQFRSYFSPELVDEVIEKCLSLLQEDPDNVSLLKDLGHVYFKKAQFIEALDQFSKALQLSPLDTPTRISSGKCLHLLKRLEEAESDFVIALQQKPEWPDTHYWVGRLRFERGSPAEALSFLEKALEMNPRFRDALHTQALVLESLDLLKETIVTLKKIIALPIVTQRYTSPFPYNIEVLFDDPLLLDEAIRQLEEFASRNPNFADVQCKLGIAYRTKGNIEKAMGAFKNALRINPKFLVARHYYWHWDDDTEAPES